MALLRASEGAGSNPLERQATTVDRGRARRCIARPDRALGASVGRRRGRREGVRREGGRAWLARGRTRAASRRGGGGAAGQAVRCLCECRRLLCRAAVRSRAVVERASVLLMRRSWRSRAQPEPCRARRGQPRLRRLRLFRSTLWRPLFACFKPSLAPVSFAGGRACFAVRSWDAAARCSSAGRARRSMLGHKSWENLDMLL